MHYSTIHKATGLMVHGHSMILTGRIPVEHKSVHWLLMGAASRNHLWGVFQPAFFWEWPVTNSAIHKAAVQPATIQNGLWRSFLPVAPIDSQWTLFCSTGIIPVKPVEWP